MVSGVRQAYAFLFQLFVPLRGGGWGSFTHHTIAVVEAAECFVGISRVFSKLTRTNSCPLESTREIVRSKPLMKLSARIHS